ncbi:hypothetical protein F8M41_022353 [Gigaspora margarita]|uniref:Uncharacterized protein n=1 Tax=Gigaspora margarita TaxID=4874 RepID=A0A8H4AF57_GIGMA|nr:hypothetical protein F8M41_022353 [Gigaspora margarita]
MATTDENIEIVQNENETNNNKVHDRAIGEFNRLKEAYSSLYKQNQRLIAENEHWKAAVEGFATAVQKNIEDATQKIIEKIDAIDGDGMIMKIIIILDMTSSCDQAIQKFEELTSAYKKLQAENKFLRESIKTTLDEINGKLNIDTLALNLSNGLKPLFEADGIKVNYEMIKQKCKEALEEMQDFLANIPTEVDELLNQLPPPSSLK